MRIICRNCHYSWTNMNGFKRHGCYKEDPTYADYNIQQSHNGNVIQVLEYLKSNILLSTGLTAWGPIAASIFHLILNVSDYNFQYTF